MATLLCLCRVLRGEDGVGAPGRRRPRGLPVGWDEVIELAFELDVAPSLWCAVQANESIPPHHLERLRAHYAANTIRNLRLRSQLVTAVRAINQAGVVPLLFKGALELVDGTREHVGERWLVDIDLAVAPEARAAAIEALVGIGYRPEPGKPYLHPHELPLHRDGSVGPLELHVELGTSRLAPVLPAAQAWADSTPLTFSGARVQALSPTHQVLHRVLHSAVQDRHHTVGGLPLRELLVLSALARAHGTAVDWGAVRGRMEEHGLARQLAAHLWLTHRLVGMQIPAAARAGSRPWKGVGSRVHEARVLLGFGLPWIPEIQRNVRFALGPEYLESLYGHHHHPLRLAAARARLITHVVWRDRSRVLHRAAERKV